MRVRESLLLAATLASSTYAVPHFALLARQTGSGTSDVICSQPGVDGQVRFPPAVKITLSDGTTSCGCGSDVSTGSGNAASYEQCNTVYPVFGTEGYNDSGLRQNACYIDSSGVAQCSTTCVPNAIQQSDGSCSASGSGPASISGSSSSTSPITEQSSNTVSSSPADGQNAPVTATSNSSSVNGGPVPAGQSTSISRASSISSSASGAPSSSSSRPTSSSSSSPSGTAPSAVVNSTSDATRPFSTTVTALTALLCSFLL